MRRLVFRLLANLLLGAPDLGETRAIVRIDSFLAAGHAFVARSVLLPRVLLPRIKSLDFLFGGKVTVSQDAFGRCVACSRMFDSLSLGFCCLDHARLLLTGTRLTLNRGGPFWFRPLGIHQRPTP